MRARFDRASFSVAAFDRRSSLLSRSRGACGGRRPEIRWNLADRHPRRAAGPRPALDDGNVDRDHRGALPRRPVHPRQELSADPDAGRGHTVSADNKVFNIRLRHGVIFHNGKEMTSEGRGGLAQSLAQGRHVRQGAGPEGRYHPRDGQVRDRDPPQGAVRVLIPNLAFENNFAAIYPKEVAEAAGDKPNTQFIGTGPFKIVERQPGPLHQDGPPRQVRGAFRARLWLGRQEGGLRGHADVDSHAGSCATDQRCGVWRGRLHLRCNGRRLRPAQGQPRTFGPRSASRTTGSSWCSTRRRDSSATRRRMAGRCARRCWQPSTRSP